MAVTESKVRQSQKERGDKKIEIANSVSILDYANKNDMDVLYEDNKIARVEAPEGEMLTVNKDRNSWSLSTGEDEQAEYGNTIRFVAKMENVEWMEALDKLIEYRGDYLSTGEYNAAYEAKYNMENQETLENISTKQKVTRREENPERQKVKTVHITEYARAMDLPVEEINRGKITIIKDARFEGMLIYNASNKWDWNSKFVHDADVIKFAEILHNISRAEAIKSLAAFADTGKVLIESKEENVSESKPLEDSMVTLTDEDLPESIINSIDIEKLVVQKPEFTQDDSTVEVNNEVHQISSIHKTMTKEQLSEILSGYRRGIDVSVFDNPELSPGQMRQLRLAVQNGINPKDFSNSTLTAEYMKEMRLAAQSGLDLNVFKNDEGVFIFTSEQAKEIRLGYVNGLTDKEVGAFAKEKLDNEAMKEIRLGLQDGMEQMKNLGNGKYTAKDIHAIRMTLLVNHILDAIKVQFRNFFDSVSAFIMKSFSHTESYAQHEPVQTTEQDPLTVTPETVDTEKTAIYHFKETIENIYEAMADELQELSLEDREHAIISALRTVIGQAREQEIATTSDMEKDKALEQAIDAFMEEKQEDALKQAALESNKADYVEQFYQNEIGYNENIFNFSNSVVNDASMSFDQKKEIFNRTFGLVYGKSTAEKWINHLTLGENVHQSEKATAFEAPKQNIMKMLQEEYEVTTVTEEIQMEVG